MNIVQLGADPTGQNDNLEVFNSAIEQYNDIEIPEGIFLIKGMLNLKSGLNISGAGPATILILNLSTNIGLSGSGVSNVRIKNLTIKNQNSISSTETVYFYDCHNVCLDSVSVEGGHFGFSIRQSADFRISKCRASDTSSYGFHLNALNYSAIIGNVGHHCGTDGFKFMEVCKYLTVANNIAISNGRDGFDFYSGIHDSTITANVSTGNTYNGFEIKGTFTEGEYRVRGCTFSGNVAKLNGEYGFSLSTVRNLSFNGNTSKRNKIGFFYNNAQCVDSVSNQAIQNDEEGFKLLTVSRSTFSNCTAIDNSYADGIGQNGLHSGWEAISGVGGNIFMGCQSLNGTISGSQGGQKHGFEIGVSGSNTKNRFIGCSFRFNLYESFRDKSGQDNIIDSMSLI